MTKTLSTKVEPRRAAAEFVLPGHPDKLCDAAVDAVVDYVRRWDPVGQCGLEAGCIFDRFFMTGRIAVRDIRVAERLQDGELHKLVRGAYASAGYGEDAADFHGEEPWKIRNGIEQALNLHIGCGKCPAAYGYTSRRVNANDRIVERQEWCTDERRNHLARAAVDRRGD